MPSPPARGRRPTSERKLGIEGILVALLAICGAVASLKSAHSTLESVFTWSALVAATLRYATPLLFAALGGLVSERSGVFNIGLEGMMLMGAFWGIYGADLLHSWVWGVLVAALSGGLLALIHAFFSIHLRANFPFLRRGRPMAGEMDGPYRVPGRFARGRWRAGSVKGARPPGGRFPPLRPPGDVVDTDAPRWRAQASRTRTPHRKSQRYRPRPRRRERPTSRGHGYFPPVLLAVGDPGRVKWIWAIACLVSAGPGGGRVR